MKLEREVLICAPAMLVWPLVSTPGWWLGGAPCECVEGEVQQVAHADIGSFAVRVDKLVAPEYAAFRWNCACPGITPTDANSTLVECQLRTEGLDVRLTVVEKGFQRISDDAAVCRQYLRSNMEGWGVGLASLREAAESELV